MLLPYAVCRTPYAEYMFLLEWLHMDKFKVQLYEESQTLRLELDDRGGREYSLRRLSGVLTRSFDGSWRSHAVETGSPEEARQSLSWKGGRRRDEPPAGNAAGEVLAAGLYLAKCLQRLDAQEWRLAFRVDRTRRQIRNARRQDVESSFQHFRVMARLKVRGQAGELEIGEGGSGETRFNLDGLARRIAEAADAQRHRRRVAFDRPVPVVLQPGEGAILFHEVLGHALEADYVHQGASPFTPADVGRPIVHESVSIHCRDERDPFFRGAAVDDEGEPRCPPLLVEQGVLRRFISDVAHQRLLKLRDHGHARLEDFRRVPQPRMYATYVQPGGASQAEIIASTPFGVYAREFGDGGLDLRAGRFYFRIRQPWLIEKGRLAAPLAPLTVSGDIREALRDVAMVGDDFTYDRGTSFCRKNGQVLPVRVGQPTVKIGKLWVRGGQGA